MEWITVGLLAALLVAEAVAISRRSAVLARVRKLENRLTEIGNQLSEEVAEKLTVESQALREEVLTRLNALKSCTDRMGAIEERIEESIRKQPEPLDAERIAAMVRPLIREAVESIDGRLRNVSETIREVKEESLEEMVARALAERGFTDVRIAGAPEDDGGRTRLTVEARRDGMTFKGPVFVEGSRVVEQRLSPAYPMFP